jgi:hypothetical protein
MNLNQRELSLAEGVRLSQHDEPMFEFWQREVFIFSVHGAFPVEGTYGKK